MHDTTENALVEISLALAMAFFALLVVALVSVAAPDHRRWSEAGHVIPRGVSEDISLASEARDGSTNEDPRHRFLLHYGDEWFNIAGTAINPSLLSRDSRKLVVALSPAVTLAAARRAQSAVRHIDPNPTLTTLSPDWMQRLEANP